MEKKALGKVRPAEAIQNWPKVAIIILNWNGWRDTVECLKSVEKLTYPTYEVIVIDNGSVDDSVARLIQWAMARPAPWGSVVQAPDAPATDLPCGAHVVLRTARLTLIRSEENLGFASGCNLGIDYVLAEEPAVDFLFLLNNDARVHPDCLSRLVAAAQTHRAAIAGAVIMSEDGRTVVFAGSRFPLELFMAAPLRQTPSAADGWLVDRVQGDAMLIRRDVVEQRKAGGWRRAVDGGDEVRRQSYGS